MSKHEQRFKNASFNLADEQGRCGSWETARLAALYDIRDELQEIKGLLSCYRIQRMFNTLERLDRRLRSKFPLQTKGG